jgi:hypothetical protein
MSIFSFLRKNDQKGAADQQSFSDFVSSPPSELKKTMKIVIRKANEDQRELVERFNKLSVKRH